MTAPARISQADVKRAARGVRAAGIPIRKIEIDHTGKIIIHTGEPNRSQKDDDEWADLK